MALFGKKKNGDEEPKGDGDAKQPEPLSFSPEKAQRFFDHAKTVGETGNFEYAMQLWLSGLRQDPTSMYGLERFLNAAVNFKGKPGKGLQTSVDGRSDVDRYLQALLAWGLKVLEPALATKAVQAAAKLGLAEQAHFIGEQALKLVRTKPKKDHFVKLMEAFASVEAYDLAVQAGDAAVQLDPSDGPLSSRVKNMSASATIGRGGFDEAGQAGGFRRNIRDAEKQRRLDESERIVKTEETVDRLIAEAEAEYQRRPEDLPTVQTLSKRLLERGRPEDEDRAMRLLKKAYEDTKQFRLRQEFGRIRIRKGRRALATYRERAEQNPGDAQAQQDYEQAQKKFLSMEIAELKLAVENYPTDLSLKFELGKRYAELRQFDEAIGLLQEAKNDARYRGQSLALLGGAFREMDWNDEAIATYHQALGASASISDDLRIELRYGLLCALQAKAERERDLAAAEEAEKLASAIAIENFSYRDIRPRREELKKLVLSLRPGVSS